MPLPIIAKGIMKSLIFTVTAGHTGTEYLAKLFNLIDGVAAYHEGKANCQALATPLGYNTIFPAIKLRPSMGIDFIKSSREAFINSLSGHTYVETDHIIGKGFIEAWWQLKIAPKLVFLKRDPRSIAKGFFTTGVWPCYSPAGFSSTYGPDDPGVLPLPRWQRLTPYQLCYWYALAMEYRQLKYKLFLSPEIYYEISLNQLTEYARFTAMLDHLNVPYSDIRNEHAEVSATKHNCQQKIPSFRLMLEDIDFEAEEAEVRQLVSWYEPYLINVIENQYE